MHSGLTARPRPFLPARASSASANQNASAQGAAAAEEPLRPEGYEFGGSALAAGGGGAAAAAAEGGLSVTEILTLQLQGAPPRPPAAFSPPQPAPVLAALLLIRMEKAKPSPLRADGATPFSLSSPSADARLSLLEMKVSAKLGNCNYPPIGRIGGRLRLAHSRLAKVLRQQPAAERAGATTNLAAAAAPDPSPHPPPPPPQAATAALDPILSDFLCHSSANCDVVLNLAQAVGLPPGAVACEMLDWRWYNVRRPAPPLPMRSRRRASEDRARKAC